MYSITNLTIEEVNEYDAWIRSKAMVFPDEPRPETGDGLVIDADPPDVPTAIRAGDRIETAMNMAHDKYPDRLHGFEIRKRGQRFIAKVNKSGPVGGIHYGESPKEDSPIVAWNKCVNYDQSLEIRGITGPMDNWTEHAPLIKELSEMSSDRGHGIGLRLRPGKKNKYVWTIDYGRNQGDSPVHNTGDFDTLALVVRAYDVGVRT